MFVFLDIGDTLVDESDFARFRHASVFRFFTERGCSITEEQYTADLNNLSMQGRLTLFEQIRWLAERNGGDTLLAMAVFRDYILWVAPEAPARFHPFPDARRTLAALARPTHATRSAYRLGIIANQPTWIRPRLRKWGLLRYFDEECVIISDEVAVSKPNPAIFQFGLLQAGVPAADAVMVGNDYAHDILPAKRLGMRTIWVEREDPYSPGAPPIEDPWAADARIEQLAEVLAALEQVAALPLANGRVLRKPGSAAERPRASAGKRPD
jgi:FMN phosphatase YigB (HAD superfamily)